VAQAELPIANQAGLPMLSPNVTFPCLTKNVVDDPACNDLHDIATQMRPSGQLTFFRLATTDDLQGKAAADFFFRVHHYHNVVVIKDDTDLYSFGLAQAFLDEWRLSGGQATPLDLSEATSTILTYQNELQAVASARPDLIYFVGDDPNGSYVLQALSNIPELKNVAFAGGDGIVDSGFVQAAASMQPDIPVYASLPITDPAHTNTTVGSDFAANYSASDYTNYRPYAASSYDCTMILIQAIKTALQTGLSTPHGAQDHAGATRLRQAVLQALAHASYQGATGSQSFDANGDTTNHTVSFYQLDLSTSQTGWKWLQQTVHP